MIATMRGSSWVVAFFVFTSSIAVWGCTDGSQLEGVSTSVSPVYIIHPPIRINSNADFNPAHGVTGGDGTQGNPYIIQNYEINGTGYGYCIHIGNTTKYFCVRNNYLHDASGNSANYFWNTGLLLYNAPYGILENNTLYSNDWFGSQLCSQSHDTRYYHNVANSNGRCGIYFWASDRVNITENVMDNNTIHGLYLQSSWYAVIENNHMANNSDSGIYGYQPCQRNLIKGNMLSHNKYGVHFDYAEGKFIHNSFISNTYRQADDNGNGIWDDGYPSGGNHWSTYTGSDLYSGPYQNSPDSDGIGDAPFHIPGVGQCDDHYPWMSPSYSPMPPPIFQIPVVTGWNLISIPHLQLNPSTPTALLDINGNTLWDRVFWYDSSNMANRWMLYNTEWPPIWNDLRYVNRTMGLWINITKVGDGYLNISGYSIPTTSIPLRAGWNLVGYPTLATNMTVANAFGGTGADIVEAFDQNATYKTRVVGPTYLLKPGEGYWVHVPADTVWTVNW
jgi:parallel beta-helix repeat protein